MSVATDFMVNIWESVFTPGPTPTLLVATNASFAALQLVLLGLLYATRSVHFIVLTLLCGGLWASINWFAREVMAVQAEAEAKTAREAAARDDAADNEGVGAGAGAGAGAGTHTGAAATSLDDQSVMDSGDDTDGTELDKSQLSEGGGLGTSGLASSSSVPDVGSELRGFNTGAAARLAPDSDSRVRRRAGATESPGEAGTDSEWEKVDG